MLMLDEPSLGLAPLIVRESLRLIASLRDSGVSIFWWSRTRAPRSISRITAMYGTRQDHVQGPAGELADDPRVIATYLGGSS